MLTMANELLDHLFKPAVYSKTSMNVRVIPQAEIDPLVIARWRFGGLQVLTGNRP